VSYGRFFTIPFSSLVTNAGGNTDLWEVLPGDDHPIRLRGIYLGQTTEVADAAEEMLDISVIRMTATITSGSGTAGAPECPDSNALAPSFTSETNGATVATTTGSTDIVYRFAWNVRSSPFEMWFDVDMAPKAIQGEGLFVRLNSTVADDLTFVGTLVVEEA
jgi:hypothetical protein